MENEIFDGASLREIEKKKMNIGYEESKQERKVYEKFRPLCSLLEKQEPAILDSIIDNGYVAYSPQGTRDIVISKIIEIEEIIKKGFFHKKGIKKAEIMIFRFDRLYQKVRFLPEYLEVLKKIYSDALIELKKENEEKEYELDKKKAETELICFIQGEEKWTKVFR